MKWNGIRVNGIPCYSVREIPFRIILSIPHLEYWSASALRGLYRGMLEIVIEESSFLREEKKGKEKAELTRLARTAERRMKGLAKDQEVLLKELYEYVLSNSGLSALHRSGRVVGIRNNKQVTASSAVVLSRWCQTKGDEEMNGKNAEAKLTKKDLVYLANELNECLGLDPEIDTSLPMKELKKLVVEAAELIEPGEDELPKKAMDLLSIFFGVEFDEEEEEVEEAEAEEVKPAIQLDEEEEEDEEEPEEEEEEEEPEEKPEPKKKERKKPQRQKGVNQTAMIRDLIRKGKKREDIIKALDKEFGKGLAWAKFRMATYERAYGEMGKNDKKL